MIGTLEKSLAGLLRRIHAIKAFHANRLKSHRNPFMLMSILKFRDSPGLIKADQDRENPLPCAEPGGGAATWRDGSSRATELQTQARRNAPVYGSGNIR